MHNGKYTKQQSTSRRDPRNDIESFGKRIWLGRNGRTYKHQVFSARPKYKIEPNLSSQNTLGKGKSGADVYKQPS